MLGSIALCYVMMVTAVIVIIYVPDINKVILFQLCIFSFCVYFVNLVAIGNFVRMGFNFVSVLSKSYEFSKIKVIAIILLVTFWTLIPLTRYLIYEQIWYILNQNERDLLNQYQ